MKFKKTTITAGSVLLISIIILALVFSNTGSVAAKASKQLDLGQKYLLEGNYQEAIIAFEKAIQIDPKNVDARLGLADTYIALGKTDDAITVLKEAMDIDPERPEPYISLAKIFMRQGDYQKAIEILEKGIKNSGDASVLALMNELKPQIPVASVKSGEYTESVTITFNNIGENDEVYYTVDGSEPNKEAIKFEAPIQFDSGKNIIRAITYRYNIVASDDVTYEYEINAPSDNVDFVDEAFEQAIRKIIDKPGGKIFGADLSEIRDIVIYGKGVIKYNEQGERTYNGEKILSSVYSSDGFSINGNNYTSSGMIRTLEDIKHFPNLTFLSINYQED